MTRAWQAAAAALLLAGCVAQPVPQGSGTLPVAVVVTVGVAGGASATSQLTLS